MCVYVCVDICVYVLLDLNVYIYAYIHAAEHGTAAAIRAVREEDRLVKFPVYRDLPPSGADLYVAEYLVSAPIFVDQVFLPQVQAFCSSVPSGQEELQRQQVDAPEAQASFGFLEVPIISSWDWHFVVV